MTAMHTTVIVTADVTMTVVAKAVDVMAEVTATMDDMMMTVTTIAVIVEATPVHVTTVRTTISTVTDRNARRSPIRETSKHVRRIAMLTIPGW